MGKTPLNVSDEDLEDLEYEETDENIENDTQDENEEEESLENTEEEPSEDEEDSSEEIDEDESEDEDEEPESDDSQLDDSTEEIVESEEESQEEDDQEGDTQPTSDSAGSSIDYAAEGKRIFQPIKANGKEIQVNNADDAITLIQMGANYGLKMTALKPHLKLIKTLEKNGLLDEEKINYLIDLSKKRPEAIRKAVKDAEIDPFDLDTDSDTEYTPNTYTVSDSEMALGEVLDELETSTSGQEVLDIVGNKWDEKSMQSLTQNPSDILKLKDQVEAGVFARVAKQIDQERLMGRLDTMSDLEAYTYVGKGMLDRGEFNDIVKTPAKSKKKKSSIRKVSNAARKKAAGTTKSTHKKTTKQFDPLAVSDEEFEKLVGSQYY